MHLNHPFIRRSILFNGDVLNGAGAVDDVIPGGGTEGTEGCGLVDAADSCHGRVSGINKICIRSSSYCRSQATAA